jgi:hypothetical protein
MPEALSGDLIHFGRSPRAEAPEEESERKDGISVTG